MICLKYGLGIDAGGTYTDGVIYDFNENKVTSFTKAVTNRENLGQSINGILDNLPKEQLSKVKLVSLSTTLATNACVEDKGRKATLILMGCKRDTVEELGHKYGLPNTKDIIFVEGQHNNDGTVKIKPDWQKLKEKVLAYRNQTNAFAVVELSGIYNPEFEIEAKTLIEDLTGLYTINSNAVSRELNFMKRAASALINAQLVPLINEFLDSVRYNLDIRKINCPLVIVRGDGTLMSEEIARQMPVETLISGPAASAVGAVNLSGRKNCIIVDMGGTTSDLALVKDGMVKFAYKGVNIGKYLTGTKSIDIKPVGLGGDSHITFDGNGEVIISARRAAPLCYLAYKWPHMLEEIKLIYNEKKKNTLSLCEFFYLTKDVEDYSMYDKYEAAIIKALKNGPLSIRRLAEAAGTSIYELKLSELEKFGIVMRSALTPTDIMHLTGKFVRFNKEASYFGAVILANRLGLDLQKLIKIIDTKVKEKLYLNIANVLLENESDDFKANGMSNIVKNLLLKGFYNNEDENLGLKFSTNFDLVGIGAPIHIFLPEVAEKLNTQCIIPENASVANAVGAITGNIAVEEIVTIKPIYEAEGISRYSCSSSEQHSNFESYEEAINWSKEEARRIASEKALERGSGEISVILNTDEKDFIPGYNEFEAATETEFDFGDIDNINSSDKESFKGGSLLLETVVIARAVGTLKWL